MKQIESEIIIQAIPETVWAILMDFNLYPDWNPFIKSISGPQEVGKKIKAQIQPPGGSAMTFTPTILVCDRNKELRWLGKLGIKGIFDGEHYFLLQSTGENQTRFVQGERFSGLLIPFMGRIFAATQQGFEQMNQALKEKAEAAFKSA